MAPSLSPELIASIVGGYNGDPFAVLGPHMTTLDAAQAVAIRTFLPWAEHVQVARDDGTLHDMERIHPDGLFEAIIPSDGMFGTACAPPTARVTPPTCSTPTPSARSSPISTCT